MKPTQYYQCRMKRADTSATIYTTAWIEARGAKVGAIVEILPKKKLWEVVEVFTEHPLPEDVLRQHQSMNRKSLPSVEPTTHQEPALSGTHHALGVC